MLDWQTGEPNAKYWVTNLLATTVGDSREKSIKAAKLTVTRGAASARQLREPAVDPVYVMPFEKAGKRGMLVVNKRSVPLELTIAGATGGHATAVEVNTEPDCSEPGFEPQVAKEISAAGVLSLGPFAVAVVTELFEG